MIKIKDDPAIDVGAILRATVSRHSARATTTAGRPSHNGRRTERFDFMAKAPLYDDVHVSKYRFLGDDPDRYIVCGIDGCDAQAVLSIWVTIRGNEYYKRFCGRHARDEKDLEKLWKRGI